jgi:hypothetical protein
MSKQQMPVMKCFNSFNTEWSEELCGGDASFNREQVSGEAVRILFAVDGEKKTARLEGPDGPKSLQRD